MSKEIYAMCLSYAKDRHEAKDFLHDGFIRVFRKIHQYKNKGSLEGWVKKCVRNNILDSLRKKKIIYSDSEFIHKYEIAEEISDSEESYQDEHLLSLVEEKMKQIPQKARVILNLYAFEGYSHQQIADELNISVGTSKSQLNRARTLLKKHLKS